MATTCSNCGADIGPESDWLFVFKGQPVCEACLETLRRNQRRKAAAPGSPGRQTVGTKPMAGQVGKWLAAIASFLAIISLIFIGGGGSFFFPAIFCAGYGLTLAVAAVIVVALNRTNVFFAVISGLLCIFAVCAALAVYFSASVTSFNHSSSMAENHGSLPFITTTGGPVPTFQGMPPTPLPENNPPAWQHFTTPPFGGMKWRMNLHMPPMQSGVIQIFEFVGLAFLAVWFYVLAINILTCWIVAKCMAAIPVRNRQWEPWTAWLLLIPLFNLIWNFFLFPSIARGYQAYFKTSGRHDQGNCSYGLAVLFCVSNALIIVPIVSTMASLVSLILLIILLVKMWHYKSLAEQDNQEPEAGLPAAL